MPAPQVNRFPVSSGHLRKELPEEGEQRTTDSNSINNINCNKMKKNLLTTILAAVGLSSFASATGMQEGLRVEPPCWWTGMETPLTLMIHAPGLSGAGVSVASDGITVKAL